MKKGLFYCQPFFGLGHLKRSLYLCRELVKSFEIDFLYGGPEEGLFFSHPYLHLHRLPVLLYEDLNSPQEIFKEREKALIPFKRQHYDFAITEMYPFSKHNMGAEIEPLLDGIKSVNPDCQIYCSLKGVMLPLKKEEWVAGKIEERYEAILNHADPAAMSIEGFMQATPAMLQKVVYTGFVADPSPLDFSKPREKRIVVSMGAGSYGEELVEAVLKVPPLFPDYEFLFSLGPKAPKPLFAKAQNSPYPNVKVVEFINAFTELLSRSALSVSLGGSTLVDAMKARIPAIVYPESHGEHVLRTLMFQKRGGITLIRKEDLFTTRLCFYIQNALQKPYQAVPFLLNGAEFTHEYLLQKLSG